ncbi:MAG: diaminopimelate decarboxylase [Streptosporangiales bacterium]|nr:diaminopimelate decarboxylase [Streptosporangiales bacterium]
MMTEGAMSAPPTDLNALEPDIWSSTAQRVGGAVQVGGVELRDLAREHGTPVYVLDEDDFRGRARAHRTAFDGFDVYYAGKAFLSTTVARWLAEDGLSLDVCSFGELTIARRAGFPAERLAFHGNNKSTEELAAALDDGVGKIVLDSFVEIDRLAKLAADRGVRPNVLVRASVGVEAHTHEFIATAHEDQKFGFAVATGEVLEAVRRVLASAPLNLVGLHSHIGSQIFDTAAFELAAHRLVRLATRVRDQHDVQIAELGLGGGLGIAYVPSDDPPETGEFAAALRTIVAEECEANGLPVPRLSVEPGRAIAGPAMCTVYEVGTVKPVRVGSAGVRTYVSVDGGMSDNIRTALYGAEHSCALVNRASDSPAVLVRVVGKHCESGDIVVREVYLPGDVAPGDLIAVPATGAYCRAMASNYNQVPKPPVVAVRQGATELVLRRETMDDLLRLDAGLSS